MGDTRSQIPEMSESGDLVAAKVPHFMESTHYFYKIYIFGTLTTKITVLL